jgi:DNA-directed RNA polymerase subunit RPC12/RpoP
MRQRKGPGVPTTQIPDGPEVSCPWCGAAVALSRFAASDEEEGTDVAVCPSCGRRVPLPLPLTP